MLQKWQTIVRLATACPRAACKGINWLVIWSAYCSRTVARSGAIHWRRGGRDAKGQPKRCREGPMPLSRHCWTNFGRRKRSSRAGPRATGHRARRGRPPPKGRGVCAGAPVGPSGPRWGAPHLLPIMPETASLHATPRHAEAKGAARAARVVPPAPAKVPPHATALLALTRWTLTFICCREKGDRRQIRAANALVQSWPGGGV